MKPDHPGPTEGEVTQEIVNLTGYRFVALDCLPILQADLYRRLADIGVLGTVLLADEGINVALAGSETQCRAVRNHLDLDSRLSGLWLKESRSPSIPFTKLKVRIRREIISFNAQLAIDGSDEQRITPVALRAWLEEGRQFTLLDTRNDYEVAAGTFENATSLEIRSFRDFPAAMTHALERGAIDPASPIVTFCTGGVRCEKAAPWLREHGFSDVLQLEGGILNYFQDCGDSHWRGDCFVFDDRVTVDTQLRPSNASLCPRCHHAVPAGEACACEENHPSA